MGLVMRGGVAILFKPSLNVNIISSFSDNAGRIIICQFQLEQITYVLTNLYAPNRDSPELIQVALDKTMEYEGNKIITGDFNTVLDVEQDRTSASKSVCNNDLSTAVLNTFIDDAGFIDPWRARYPDKMQYTWSKSKPSFMLRTHGAADCGILST